MLFYFLQHLLKLGLFMFLRTSVTRTLQTIASIFIFLCLGNADFCELVRSYIFPQIPEAGLLPKLPILIQNLYILFHYPDLCVFVFLLHVCICA